MPSRLENAAAAAKTTLCNQRRDPVKLEPGSDACNYARSSSQENELSRVSYEPPVENIIPKICRTCPVLIEALVIHGFTIEDLPQLPIG